MIIFYISLFSSYIFSLISRICDKRRFKIMSMLFFSIIIITLIVISGLRRGIGDTSAYKHSYELLYQNIDSFKIDKDFGFSILMLVLMQISSDPQILVFVTALITNLLNCIVFYKYRNYIELQLYMYIAAGYYLVTMNGIRQCLAAALLFICTPLIIRGNLKLYLTFILLISTIHASALIMIPIYFIAREKPWSRKILIMIIISIISALFYDIFMQVLNSTLSNTQYSQYAEFSEGGSSVLRAIINLVPVILAYIKKDELKEKWPESNIFINISLINSVFVSFGMFNWIFNRFSIYFQLYNFILLPYIIGSCFKEKEKRLVYFLFVICYFIFFYREQVIGLNMNYTSDYLNFNNIFYKYS